MSLREKIAQFLGISTSDSKFEEKDMLEFRQKKVELLKSEISSLVTQFDENEEYFSGLKKQAQDQIEKGEKDVLSVKDKIESKYSSRRDEILRSLGEKKVELLRQEFRIDQLLKAEGSSVQDYADAIVKDSKGNILMLLRTNGDTFEPNKWGLPGGKIEAGEEPSEAVKRELKEETGLVAKGCYPMAEKKLDNGGTIYYFCVYVDDCCLDMVSLDSEEHMNYAFMSVDEIKSRSEANFILDLKRSLLDMVEPRYGSFLKLEKAHQEGQLDSETYKGIVDTYSKFNFHKVENE